MAKKNKKTLKAESTQATSSAAHSAEPAPSSKKVSKNVPPYTDGTAPRH